MRLIDAEDLKKTWYKEHNIEPGEMGAMFVGNNEVPKFIDRARTIDPVRHGRWEVIDAEEPRRYGCSECKRLSWNMENYCGNCGARMDGENDE